MTIYEYSQKKWVTVKHEGHNLRTENHKIPPWDYVTSFPYILWCKSLQTTQIRHLCPMGHCSIVRYVYPWIILLCHCSPSFQSCFQQQNMRSQLFACRSFIFKIVRTCKFVINQICYFSAFFNWTLPTNIWPGLNNVTQNNLTITGPSPRVFLWFRQ